MLKEISIYLQLRRFRRRLKSKEKQKQNRIRHYRERELKNHYGKIGEEITSLADAYEKLLPRNLQYLLAEPQSPFYLKKLSKIDYDEEQILLVPKVFSIIDNPEKSFDFIRRLVSIFVYQACYKLTIEYKDCDRTDLLTHILMDAILKDMSTFFDRCVQVNAHRFINIKKIHGRYIGKENLKRMINSVGSPVVLLNRKSSYHNVMSYDLRCLDGMMAQSKIEAQQDYDATTLLLYVDNCLKRMNKQLTRDALRELGVIVSEAIINAEEHSSLKYRYLVGYFEETSEKESNHYGMLNIVIFNFGQTIYEKFKCPEQPINEKATKSMESLSSLFIKKGLFAKKEFTEETLWTLYALQGGVTSVPDQIRGDGTIRFIDSFFKIKGDSSVDHESHLYLLSGSTRIDFDGTYRPVSYTDSEGNLREIISFNESGSLEEKPNPTYVKSVESYFPGTAIYARLRIDDNDIKTIKQ